MARRKGTTPTESREVPGRLSIRSRYAAALASIPPPGGNGCHPALLGVANLGVMLGLSDAQITADIEASVPPGSRRVTRSEIPDAIRRARVDTVPVTADVSTGWRDTHSPRPKPAFDGEAARRALITRGGTVDVMDVLDQTGTEHVRLTWPPEDDTLWLLRLLYEPTDRLFIGTRYSSGRECVRPVSEWLDLLTDHASRPAHIIPNPLTGEQGTTKAGGLSYRADGCVRDFRFCMAEFDGFSKPDQLAFWRGLGVEIVALIDSGGKSCHAWLRVDCAGRAEWDDKVERQLYGRLLEPLGVDSACKNESRLSRLPGVQRNETGRWQKLLWLCPAGGAI